MSDLNPLFDINENIEVETFDYRGENPPANMLMEGVVHRVYLTRDSKNAPMLKVVYKTAAGKYEGFAAWENISITDAAAFKWKALCEDVLNVTPKDLKTRTFLAMEDPTANGMRRVESIGDVVLDGYTPVTFSVIYPTHKDADTGAESVQTKVNRAWGHHEK